MLRNPEKTAVVIDMRMAKIALGDTINLMNGALQYAVMNNISPNSLNMPYRMFSKPSWSIAPRKDKRLIINVHVSCNMRFHLRNFKIVLLLKGMLLKHMY